MSSIYYHVIEHFSHQEAPRIVGCWFRMLRPGGRVVMECPDFAQAARDVLEAIRRG